MIKKISYLALFCCLISVSAYGQGSHDIFPLSIGNSFKYLIQTDYQKLIYNTPSQDRKSDAIGSYTYNVISLTSKPDTNIWCVSRYDTMHYYEYYKVNNAWEMVIEYVGNDSTSFYVYEALADSHRVTLSKKDVVWNLPSTFYRYSSYEEKYNKKVFYFTSDDFEYDTLIFKKNLGITRRFQKSTLGIESIIDSSKSARLIESIILDAPVGMSKNIGFALQQNYPNPFNPSTKISYSVGSTQAVTVKIYDVLGKLVTTLVNEEKPAGTYQVQWNAGSLPSGIYFCEMKSGSFKTVNKMLLMK